jgi:hypothetical protein
MGEFGLFNLLIIKPHMQTYEQHAQSNITSLTETQWINDDYNNIIN